MILADYVDYDTAEIYDQKKTDSCTAHAFFTLLSEWCQQDRGMDLEFDIMKYFKQMEKERPSGKFRLNWLSTTAREKGFKAKTGELVKITGYSNVIAKNSFRRLCETIQRNGPLILAINTYKGLNLRPKDTDIIKDFPDDAVRNRMGHVLMIRGFDYPGRLIKLQDSYGAGSVKWLPLNIYLKVVKGAYFFKGITIS